MGRGRTFSNRPLFLIVTRVIGFILKFRIAPMWVWSRSSCNKGGVAGKMHIYVHVCGDDELSFLVCVGKHTHTHICGASTESV